MGNACRARIVRDACPMKAFCSLNNYFWGAKSKNKKNRQHAGSLPLGWKFAAESEVCRCSKFAAGVKLLISYL